MTNYTSYCSNMVYRTSSTEKSYQIHPAKTTEKCPYLNQPEETKKPLGPSYMNGCMYGGKLTTCHVKITLPRHFYHFCYHMLSYVCMVLLSTQNIKPIIIYRWESLSQKRRADRLSTLNRNPEVGKQRSP